MTNQESAFQAAIEQHFGFLTLDYGFSIEQDSEYLFIARSKHCIVKIYLDWPQIAVSIQPTDPRKAGSCYDPAPEIGLSIILECLSSNSEPLGKTLAKPEEIFSEAHRLSRTLREHCDSFLRGDFHDWRRLEICSETFAQKRKQEHAQWVEDLKLRDVRSKAALAFRMKDYETAMALYESIRDDLTPAEISKLSYARKHI